MVFNQYRALRRIVLVARTTKLENAERRSDGISLFLIDLPNPGITYTPIEKHGFRYYKSNSVFLDNVRIPASNLMVKKVRALDSF